MTHVDPDEVRAVLEKLASSVVWLPQDLPEGVEAAPGGPIVLPVIEQGGNRYVPCFSSRRTLVTAGADPAAAIEVPLAYLAAGCPGDDTWLVMDPATGTGVTLPPHVVRVLPGLVGAGPN